MCYQVTGARVQAPFSRSLRTFMAPEEWSNQFNPARNDSRVFIQFPKDFDTKADIVVPGKVTTFHRDLNNSWESHNVKGTAERDSW